MIYLFCADGEFFSQSVNTCCIKYKSLSFLKTIGTLRASEVMACNSTPEPVFWGTCLWNSSNIILELCSVTTVGQNPDMPVARSRVVIRTFIVASSSAYQQRNPDSCAVHLHNPACWIQTHTHTQHFLNQVSCPGLKVETLAHWVTTLNMIVRYVCFFFTPVSQRWGEKLRKTEVER